MSRHLVIGASGQIGHHLLRELERRGESGVGTFRTHSLDRGFELDVRDTDRARELVRTVRPRVLHVPAALSEVDRCERAPARAREVNVAPLPALVEAANEVEAKLVFYSSDYVFDGRAGPYVERDEPDPICEYGRQKLAGERLVMEGAADPMVVRTTVVFGPEPQGKNFVARLLRSLSDGEEVRVPSDQVGTPTYAPSLARAVLDLADAGVRGLVHLAGPNRMSRYELAQLAARELGLDEHLIRPVPTSALDQAAVRPLAAGLLTGRPEAPELMACADALAEMASDLSRMRGAAARAVAAP